MTRPELACATCADPAPADTPMCERCRQRTGRELAALPSDVAALGAVVPLHGAPQPRVSGTHTPGVPIDLAADALSRAIVWRCAVWEPLVRHAAGLPWVSDQVAPARLVSRAARVLSSSLSDFLALPATWGYAEGPEAGYVARSGLSGVLSLRRLHQRATWLVGITRPSWHVPGLCRRCGAASLMQADRSDSVECGHCGRQTDADGYRKDLLMA